MTTLVIDISRSSIRRSFSDNGVSGRLRYLLWFRVIRPALVLSIWGLLGLYVYCSISNMASDGLLFEQLRRYGVIIAGMGGALMVWMILSHLDRAVRRKMMRVPSASSPDIAASPAALSADALFWQRPGDTRLLVVDHDDGGDITHVHSWLEWKGRQHLHS